MRSQLLNMVKLAKEDQRGVSGSFKAQSVRRKELVYTLKGLAGRLMHAASL